MRFLDTLLRYLQDESGFLGLGGDKVTRTSSRIGKEDQAYVDQIRRSGENLAGIAATSRWAPDADPLTQRAVNQYGQAYGQYGGIAGQYGGMARDAFGGAMQTGLSGIGAYANPYAQMQIDAMNPTWDYQRQLASMQGMQAGNAPGVSHSQQARSALLEAELLGGVNRAQSQYEGDVWGQAGAQGLQAMMAERQRLGGLGGQMGQMGLAGLAGQQDVTRNQALMGDYMRNIEQQKWMDRFNRAQAGNTALRQSYMGPTEQHQKNVEEGSVFGDLMGIAGMGIGALTGGAGSAVLGMLGGGGPKASPSLPVPQATFGSPSIYDYNVPGARPVFAPQYPG